MMKKEELLAVLRKGMNEEDRAIPLYVQHLNSTFFLSDFTVTDQQIMRDLLLQLKKESETHVKIYETLIRTVEVSDKDVY